MPGVDLYKGIFESFVIWEAQQMRKNSKFWEQSTENDVVEQIALNKDYYARTATAVTPRKPAERVWKAKIIVLILEPIAASAAAPADPDDVFSVKLLEFLDGAPPGPKNDLDVEKLSLSKLKACMTNMEVDVVRLVHKELDGAQKEVVNDKGLAKYVDELWDKACSSGRKGDLKLFYERGV